MPFLIFYMKLLQLGTRMSFLLSTVIRDDGRIFPRKVHLSVNVSTKEERLDCLRDIRVL